MTQQHEVRTPARDAEARDDGPQNLPRSAWVSLIIFAGFVVLFGACAGTFMFN